MPEKKSYVVELPKSPCLEHIYHQCALRATLATTPAEAIGHVLYKKVEDSDLAKELRYSVVGAATNKLKGSYGPAYTQFATEIPTEFYEDNEKRLNSTSLDFSIAQEVFVTQEILDKRNIPPFEALKIARKYICFANNNNLINS